MTGETSPPAIDYESMFALLSAWDTDGDGLVSSDDFKQGLSSIGFQISVQDADVLCRALDADGQGNIKIDSLAELLEAPSDAGDGLPVPPAKAIEGRERGMSLDEQLNASEIPPELRAWEALAAADPAAAAEAIAALPDDQAHALHMALGAAAAAGAAAAGAPTGASPSHFLEQQQQQQPRGYYEDAEDDDEASLALARSAQRAMEQEAIAQQQQQQRQQPTGGDVGYAGSSAASSAGLPAASMIAAPAMAADAIPPPPPQTEPMPIQPPPPLNTMHSCEPSEGLGELSESTRSVTKRRSFGSLAARFSMRSPGNPPVTPSQLLPGGASTLPPGVGGLGDLQIPSSATSCAGGAAPFDSAMSLPSGPASVCDQPPRPMSRTGSVSFSIDGMDRMSRAGSFAQLSRLGSRSSMSVSFEKRETLYKPEDVATLPQKLGELLLGNHARAIDLFRAMDTTGDGTISRDEFAKSLGQLGLLGKNHPNNPLRSVSPGGRSKSPSGRKSPAGRDYEREIDELFATFDVNGDGSLDYEELHRLLRVGQNSRMSEYLRASVAGKSLPPQLRPAVSYIGEVAKPKPIAPRSKEASARSGPGIALAIDPMPEVREDEWPTQLRGLLLRERERVVDLFRHWEGVGEGGRISIDHFKAGLFVLGHRAAKPDVERLYEAMGVGERDGGMLKFTELRRQLRVVANRGCSAYLRDATRQGLELQASQPRGSLLSGVAEKLDQTPVPSPHMNILAALTLASTTHGKPDASAGGPVTAGTESLLAASPSRTQCRGGLLGGISCSSHYSDGVVGLGADAASSKERALAAASDAAQAAQRGSASLLASEMWLQQWSRGHYSALLPELRKWELYPEGMITFDVFADSLNNIGFPAAGRWNEVEAVFYSWEPDESGRLHWNVLRNRMTGGRLVRVQQAKHNTVSYYKQASRAGEGFGNRSSSRFNYETVSRVGPGKYSPAAAAKDRQGGGGHSGKINYSAPRFLKKPQSDAPGPGKYTPRHTLLDGRNEIPPA